MTTPQSKPTRAALEGLAERCEAATGPDRELDRAIMDAVFQPWQGYAGCRDADTDEPVEDTGWIDGKGLRGIGAPNLTGSLDSAMSLVPEGWAWTLYSDGPTYPASAEMGPHPIGGAMMNSLVSSGAETPALALCAAALLARAASKEEK